MNENEEKVKIGCVPDIVEAYDLSYHVGKVIENLVKIEIAVTKTEAQNLADEAKMFIDRYVKYQWGRTHNG